MKEWYSRHARSAHDPSSASDLAGSIERRRVIEASNRLGIAEEWPEQDRINSEVLGEFDDCWKFSDIPLPDAGKKCQVTCVAVITEVLDGSDRLAEDRPPN